MKLPRAYLKAYVQAECQLTGHFDVVFASSNLEPPKHREQAHTTQVTRFRVYTQAKSL